MFYELYIHTLQYTIEAITPSIHLTTMIYNVDVWRPI